MVQMVVLVVLVVVELELKRELELLDKVMRVEQTILYLTNKLKVAVEVLVQLV
tara:strand:- start:258 stop:416 length:159 start_codon:yes stop_codon:yes gene_type:complete